MTTPSPAAKKAAELLRHDRTPLSLVVSIEHHRAKIIDQALAEERKAAEEMAKWIETEMNEDPREQQGEEVIAAYKRARGQA